MGIQLWLRHRYVRRDNRRWHDYTIHAPDGEVRFTATAARVPGPITLWSAPATVETARGRPRRSFPLTGRYDVIAPPDTRLGVITRLGRIYDAAGARIGRYRDARSLKEHVGEGVLTLVVESLIGGDAAAATRAVHTGTSSCAMGMRPADSPARACPSKRRRHRRVSPVVSPARSGVSSPAAPRRSSSSMARRTGGCSTCPMPVESPSRSSSPPPCWQSRSRSGAGSPAPRAPQPRLAR